MPALLETTENRGAGIETEEVLELTLDTTVKSGGGIETDVADEDVGVLLFEIDTVDERLVLDTDVVLELGSDVEAFDTVSELIRSLESEVRVTDEAVDFREALGATSIDVVLLIARSLETGEMLVDGVREAL